MSIDKLISEVVTVGDGLYIDTTKNGRYVYRGTNPNNYITFNGEEAGWRIIAIEPSGELKIMKQLMVNNTMAFDTANLRSDTYCNTPSNGCNVWGSKNTMLDSLGNRITEMPRLVGETGTYELPIEEASSNIYLNSTYYDSLSSSAKEQISTHDFNVGLLVGNNASSTLENEIIQEESYKWTGKIGLINATDYVKATTNSECTSAYIYKSNSSCYGNASTTNYMYTTQVNYWITMTPYSAKDSYYIWCADTKGNIRNGNAKSTIGVRPALYLKPDIKLTGNGTETEPYTIISK